VGESCAAAQTAAGARMATMALDGDVRRNLLDRTDAEKVFRPWWDTLEDMLLNTLIGLGERQSANHALIHFDIVRYAQGALSNQ